MSKRANGDGGIYRRASDGRWVGALTYVDDQGKRRRHVFYGQLRREVAAKLEEARERLRADEPVKDARTTMAAFVEDWIRKALPASARKASTQSNYATIARTHLAPAPFGALTLDKLRPSDIEALLVAKRAAGLSDSTVRLIYTVSRAVLDIAVRDGIVRRNVAAAVSRPTIRRNEARYLTADEAERLLEAARGDRLQPLIVLMLGTGLRRGEALALHWRDVDLAAGHVRVRWTLARVERHLVFDEPKTERSRRYVSLPSPVAEVLRRHRTALAAEQLAAPAWQPWTGHDDLVFPTQIGTPTDPRNALRAFEGIAERAGLTGVGLHTLRHSTASALIAAGEHIKVVQELLGHSSYAITADIYSHVNVEQQRAAAERLGEAFRWGQLPWLHPWLHSASSADRAERETRSR
jgi:integrase